MADTQPHQLTPADWREIGQVSRVRQLWGVRDHEDFAEYASRIYAAKFDYTSGGPGYVGELFLLQGDALTDAPPVVLRRDNEGKLIVAA